MVQDLAAGEEVDFESACIVESEKLTGYTFSQLEMYEMKTPMHLSEKKQKYYTPKMPYFQDL